MSKGVLKIHKTGLFGKLPQTGDFVSRGLPAGLRPVLDRWLTAKFMRLDFCNWPTNGYRGAFAWNDVVVCALVMASQDKLGREFPLSVCFVAQLRDLSISGIDQWCDAALPFVREAQGGHMAADKLLDHVRQIPFQKDTGVLPELPTLWPGADRTPVNSG
ncbi:MAG: type VI secretion system-associated protein TagF [Paracoccaceae bacterium]